MCIPDLSHSERDFFLLSVELPGSQLLRNKGLEASDSCINCIEIT